MTPSLRATVTRGEQIVYACGQTSRRRAAIIARRVDGYSCATPGFGIEALALGGFGEG
jgi:hypothetical protein